MKFNQDFEKRILSSGTIKDRVALLIEKVHKSPNTNLNHLETLVNMVSPKSKRESLFVMDLLKELFIEDIIPKGNLEETAHVKTKTVKHIAAWFTEPKLRDLYEKFVNNLSVMLKDTITATKQKALAIVHDLAAARTAHRLRLLQLMVNKLGDPERRVASSALHRLRLLSRSHSELADSLIEETERYLHRTTGLTDRSLHYGLCFLNHFVLSAKQVGQAERLIRIYCGFFRAAAKRGEPSRRLLAAILCGLRRALPYVPRADHMKEHLDTLFRMVHTVSFNVSVQALMILQQIAEQDDSLADRFYASLYRKLTSEELKSANKKAMFLHLVYRSMRRDQVQKRVLAFAKRLLQVCTLQDATFVCGALLLMNKLNRERPGLITNAMRQLQVASDDDDEEEHLLDVVSDAEEATAKESVGGASSWLHRQVPGARDTQISRYDPWARNPLHCGCENEGLWELVLLRKHFHPSVRVFVEDLSEGRRIDYSGNPLNDFKLKRFLDRFSYKNPKQLKKDVVNFRFRDDSHDLVGAKALAVDSAEYVALHEKHIPEDERFMYRYFKSIDEKRRARRKEEEASDAESVSDDEFDNFLDEYESGRLDSKKELVDFSTALATTSINKKKKKAGEDEDEEDEDDDFGSDLPDDSLDGSFNDDDGDEEEDEDDEPQAKKRKKRSIMDEFVSKDDLIEQMDYQSDSENDEAEGSGSKALFDFEDDGDGDEDDGDGDEDDEDFDGDGEDDEDEVEDAKSSRRNVKKDRPAALSKSDLMAMEEAAEEFGDELDKSDEKLRKQMEWEDRRASAGMDKRLKFRGGRGGFSRGGRGGPRRGGPSRGGRGGPSRGGRGGPSRGRRGGASRGHRRHEH